MNRSKIINLVGFNILWLACTWGGNIIALVSLIIFIQVHILYVSRSLSEWYFSFGFVAVGLMIETAIQSFGVISFSGAITLNIANSDILLPPPWLIFLWLGFSTTLHHSLTPLWGRPILIAIACFTGVPWSYYAGAKLSGSTISNPVVLALLIEALAWAVLLVITTHILKRQLIEKALTEPEPQ